MELDIRSFGAVGDGKTLSTQAIQETIDKAAELKATVVIDGGRFLSGALFLKQGMSLHLKEGGTLLGSENLFDYPIVETRFEGRSCLWPLALLNAQNLTDTHVYGKGVLDGNGFSFWARFWDARKKAILADLPFSNRDIQRPRLCFFEGCRGITLEGVTLQNSAFWNLHLYNSEMISVKGLTIQAPHEGIRAASSDAIDIDACSNVTISDCTFSTDDDCVCIKGGKGPEAHLLNRPTENIIVENCRFGFGHGVVTLGSEASLVRNVIVRNCTVLGENSLIRCKFRPDTFQHFENIVFENISITDGGWLFDVRPWVSRQDELLGSGLESKISNLVVRNIKARGMQSPGVLGQCSANLTLEGIRLESIEYTSAVGATGRLIRADEVEKQETDPDVLTYDPASGLSMSNVVFNGILQAKE